MTDSPALPKPVQAGGVPIIIGGGGPKRTPALAARYAAEYNAPFVSVERFVEQRDRVAAACAAIDRDPASIRYSAAPSCASAPTRPSTRGGPRRSAGSPTSCARTASPAPPTRSRRAIAALGRRRRRAALPAGARPRRPRPPRRHRRSRRVSDPYPRRLGSRTSASWANVADVGAVGGEDVAERRPRPPANAMARDVVEVPLVGRAAGGGTRRCGRGWR